MLAPIVSFVYNRPVHTRTTLEALKNNYLADQSTLYIYADGPKDNASKQDIASINETRKLIREQKWCKEVVIIESKVNKGCNKNIMDGINEMFTRFDKLIIVEDDIMTSKGFLKYMNDALDLYENDSRVMHISGYFPPNKLTLPETFFIKLSQIWGWATWKRAWSLYNTDADDLANKIASTNRIDEFTFGGYFYAFETLKSGMEGVWDTKWGASVFVEKGLVLTPGISMVQNIGHDGSGINCGPNNNFFIEKLAEEINIKKIKVEENKKAANAYRDFLIKDLDIKKPTTGNLHDFIPKAIINTGKRIISPKHRELRRIEKLPLFKDCRQFSFNIFSKPIKIYSGRDFFFNYNEIFNDEIFRINPKNQEPLIVDIGSGIGLSAIYFKTLFPKSSLILFEQDFLKHNIQKHNIESFNFSNISSYSGDLIKFAKDISISELKEKRIDLLKIDIPGKEIDLLEELKEILPNTDNVFVRYSSYNNKKQELEKILEILANISFRYYININSYRSPQPFDKINIGSGIDNRVNIFGYKK